MLKLIIPFINPVKLIQACYYQIKHPKDRESNRNSELLFYAKILKNDMLHLGYFKNINTLPEDISFNQIENAQTEYTKLIADRISNKLSPVLDVGCGMGGLSKILFDNGFKVESLTPDRQQKNHIDKKYNSFPCHHTKFEQFTSNTKYGTVINSESLQYIKLDQAFETVEKILVPGGKWIITDYFRIRQDTINRSGHMLKDFLSQTDKHNWKIIDEQDITLNILPTLRFVYMYVERFFQPLSEFAKDKLRYKQPWLYYLSGNFREAFLNKANKEIAAIDPGKFAQEKSICSSFYRRITCNYRECFSEQAFFTFIVPYHRIIRSSRHPGSYQGSIEMKRALIENEGIPFDNAGRLACNHSCYTNQLAT